MSSASFWTLTSCTCNTVATELLSKSVARLSTKMRIFLHLQGRKGVILQPVNLFHISLNCTWGIGQASGISQASTYSTPVCFLIDFRNYIKIKSYFEEIDKNFSSYLPIVLIFFLVSAGNNYIFSFEIPFPLIIIFRSVSYFPTKQYYTLILLTFIIQGTLVANVLLTWLLQNRCYSFSRIISVLMITAGIVLFTLGSERQNSDNANAYSSSNDVPRSDLVSRGSQFFVGMFSISQF
jgi:hypothetical protein